MPSTRPRRWPVLRGRVLSCAAALAGALVAGVAGAATVRVSVTTGGTQAFGSFSAISGDGRYVAFSSSSTTLTQTTITETYVRDVVNGTTTWVSSHPPFTNYSSNGAYGLAISQNGRIAAFGSDAPTLDANSFADVFVRNLDTNVLTRASAAAPGGQENGISYQPALSSDGRYVAFVSAANLLPADTNATADIYLRDTQTGTLYLMSVAYNGAQASAACANRPAVSDDGCLVAFSCSASNLVPNDNNGSGDVFVRDRCAGTTERVSVASDGTERNAESGDFGGPAISADGRYVAFHSLAGFDPTDLGSNDIYVRDRQLGQTQRVSFAINGSSAATEYAIAMSRDGRFVAYSSLASNIVPSDTNNGVDVFVYDRTTGTTTRRSVANDGSQGMGSSRNPSVSDDGTFVAFDSTAPLVPEDSNSTTDTYRNQIQAVCGNGVLEPGEACDDGNTANGDCCSATCQYESSATVCRPSAGTCDVAENCTGSSGSCPADAKAPSGTVCRSAAGVCDVPEACNGVNATCPSDGFASSATVCRSSAGVCDVAETCTGASPACPADAKVASGTVCRSAAGVCDLAESCNGSSAACPADAFKSSATVCRSSAGVCDLAENCTGASTSCPADAFAPSTTVCRSAAGVCDNAETCTGSTAACPADSFKSSAIVCRSSAGVCDVAESCTGGTAACPADGFQASGTVCRSSAGVCDVAENCTGASASCPADAFAPSTAVCRSAAGVCDVAESCTGASATCPPDAFLSSATVCRSSAGVCDVVETCTGSSAACPGDGFQGSGTVCRSAAGVCDVAESCTGASATCPPDAFLSSATVCRSSAGVCDVAETCTGSGAACPGDGFQGSGTVCRSAAGVCDVAESCTGASAACPGDGFRSAATVCRSAAGECDLAETCTGASAACPADAVKASGTGCTDDGNACTLDQCDGTSVVCVHSSNPACACGNGTVEPDNQEECDAGAANGTPTSCCTATCTFRAAGQTCRASAGVCDVPETCTGSSATCPADVLLPSTTVCRSAAGVCDVAEQCTGSSASCPDDGFEASTTVCRSAAGDCDVAEHCTGAAAACPANGVQPSGTGCTDDGHPCTLDQCDGVGVACIHSPNPACVCGNGTLEQDNNEQCDAGAANGTPTSCCTATCQLRAAGETCRSSAGVCDTPEACTGNSASCPPDGFLPSTTVCRSAAGECDLPESCSGAFAACPADTVKGAGTGCTDDGNACTLDRCDGVGVTCTHTSDPACACGNGVVEPGNNEECDGGASNGAATSCCTNACRFRGAGETCRTSAGVCDVAETCTGASGTCPGDVFLPSATECRAAAGVCDVAESCTGTSAVCPADVFKPSTTVCRSAAGVCDVAETCTGGAAACPADIVRDAGVACPDDGNACTLDQCDGTSVACGHPANPTCGCGNGTLEPDNHEDCDAGSLNGASTSCCTATCTFRGAGQVCRPSTGACDVAETCTGSAGTCPADVKAANGTPCTDGVFCNGTDSCSGGTCSLHKGNPCPGPDGDADCAESCVESTKTCTGPDPDGSMCTDGDQCTVGDVCAAGVCKEGTAVTCPAGELCNPSTGICGPSATCAASCDDGNPCTTDTCDATLGKCVSVPVTDGQACQHPDECTSGTPMCAAGTCGVQDCQADATQVTSNGVPQPAVDVNGRIFVKQSNGAPQTGTLTAQLVTASNTAALTNAGLRVPKATILSKLVRAKIKNGSAVLRLLLNKRGKKMLDASPTGALTVEVRITIRAKRTRAHVRRLVTLHRL